MGDKTGIEWTDATWNPVRGCTRVSPGCGGPGEHGGCYAEIMAARFSMPGMWGHGFAEIKGGDHRWTGKVELVEKMLDVPFHWRKPRKIFANSTSDLFHEKLSFEAIDRIFAVMALCQHHTFQILTKRPERMREYVSQWFERLAKNEVLVDHPCGKASFASLVDWAVLPKVLSNVWLGTSVEDQQRADERVPLLLDAPAAVRFLSCEPMLGPIDLSRWLKAADCDSDLGISNPGIDWVICGGESGTGARPMHPDWTRGLRDQCADAGVPFFFKQWGEWTPGENVSRTNGIVDTARWFGEKWSRRKENLAENDGHVDDEPDLYCVGRNEAGSTLDGREHKEFPRMVA